MAQEFVATAKYLNITAPLVYTLERVIYAFFFMAPDGHFA
jgi:hypothetical protein